MATRAEHYPWESRAERLPYRSCCGPVRPEALMDAKEIFDKYFEALLEQPLVISYYECPPEDRLRYCIPDNMIRLACGIENSEDLVADLKQALER